MTDPDDPRLVRCDRCGRDCRATDEHPRFDDEHANALEGHFFYQGCYGSTRADLELWKAELCEDCTVAVRAFIDAGPSAAEQAAGRPCTGRGVTVIDNLIDEEATFAAEQGYGSGDELLPRGFDVDLEERQRRELTGWLMRRHRIALPSAHL